MARSDLLINLVKAGVNGDTGTFRRTVDAIVAEERGKQHNVLADQIERVVRTTNGNTVSNAPRHAPEANQRARDFVSEIMPRRRLDELVLPETTKLATQQLIEEQQRANVLRSHSLEPRHRILLVGPPGNGKWRHSDCRGKEIRSGYCRCWCQRGCFQGTRSSSSLRPELARRC